MSRASSEATDRFTCFAICAPGLERIVSGELIALGERPHPEDGGVTWTGDLRSIMRANLWLRSASRIVTRVARFRATAFFELEKRAKAIPWERFVAAGASFEFKVTARKSKLYHSDAIAERLVNSVGSRSAGTRADGQRPTAGGEPRERGTTQLFIVRVFRDEFTVSADTSGELLHVRGYRQAVGKAPIRETLAAALLLAAEWKADSPLLDPLCGSGTIPIEGALLARRRAPGIARPFAFMRWPEFEERAWTSLVEQAKAGELNASLPPIFGSDRDAGAIASARANAQRAGVAADVHFDERALSAITPPDSPGLVATNPPYGARVGDASWVRDLYAQLGNVLRSRCPGWSVVLYSPNRRLAQQIALPLEEMTKTRNGGIPVSLLCGRVRNGSGRTTRAPGGGRKAINR